MTPARSSMTPRAPQPNMERLALVLPGGGARAAYQAGVLSRIAEALPELHLPIVTGVSAGAINAAYVASHGGSLSVACKHLQALWTNLRTEDVMRVTPLSAVANVGLWGARLFGGGSRPLPQPRGLMDTEPLRHLLARTLGVKADDPTLPAPIPGVSANIERGHLRAFAVTTTNYTTGKSATFVQQSPSEPAVRWERPYRHSETARIGIEHIMASAAIPLLFPAVSVGTCWHGDGGVRHTVPLSPALHLGATKILAISTLRPPRVHAPVPERLDAYPAPAQVLGVLINSIFLDNLHFDAAQLRRINRMLRKYPEATFAKHLRPVELMVLRPSKDLGHLARHFEHQLPRTLRYLTRGWGTRQSRSADVLAAVLFEGAFTQHLIELGRTDAERRLERIAKFLAPR